MSYSKWRVNRDYTTQDLNDPLAVVKLKANDIIYSYKTGLYDTTIKAGTSDMNVISIDRERVTLLNDSRAYNKHKLRCISSMAPEGTVFTGKVALVFHDILDDCDEIELTYIGRGSHSLFVSGGIHRVGGDFFFQGHPWEILKVGTNIEVIPDKASLYEGLGSLRTRCWLKDRNDIIRIITEWSSTGLQGL